jgi:uncharacterized membrane protein
MRVYETIYKACNAIAKNRKPLILKSYSCILFLIRIMAGILLAIFLRTCIVEMVEENLI